MIKVGIEEIVYVLNTIYLLVILDIIVFKTIGNLGTTIFLSIIHIIMFMAMLMLPIFLGKFDDRFKANEKNYYIVLSFVLIILNFLLTRRMILYG